ncbi:unnamed protein product [Gordionus sp. m RMFG-2023]
MAPIERLPMKPVHGPLSGKPKPVQPKKPVHPKKPAQPIYAQRPAQPLYNKPVQIHVARDVNFDIPAEIIYTLSLLGIIILLILLILCICRSALWLHLNYLDQKKGEPIPTHTTEEIEPLKKIEKSECSQTEIECEPAKSKKKMSKKSEKSKKSKKSEKIHKTETIKNVPKEKDNESIHSTKSVKLRLSHPTIKKIELKKRKSKTDSIKGGSITGRSTPFPSKSPTIEVKIKKTPSKSFTKK